MSNFRGAFHFGEAKDSAKILFSEEKADLFTFLSPIL